MDNKEDKQTLTLYLPPLSVGSILNYIKSRNVQVRISKPRHTKLGDYRPPSKSTPHRISVNGDLNEYSFLITLVHEFAHLEVWEAYKNKVKPHGVEWQHEYRKQLKLLIKSNVFPKDIEKAIVECFFQKRNRASTSCEKLDDVIRQYSKEPPLLRVKDIEDNAIFTLKSGRKFLKLSKLRKRYKCQDIRNKRIYLVHPSAEIIMLE